MSVIIIDYKVNAKYLPSEREVWLQSRRAEMDGHQISRALLKAMESGEIKYVDGQFYRLCRHCMDYLPLDEFYENKRYILGVSYICKRCAATRRRIKSYGLASFVSNTGMKELPYGITFNLDEETKKIIKGRIDNGCNEEEDC